MPSLLIRNIESKTKQMLRNRAAQNGCSMEEEVRSILRLALSKSAGPELNLGQVIHKRFKEIGGIELEFPPREPMRDPPSFAETVKRKSRR